MFSGPHCVASTRRNAHTLTYNCSRVSKWPSEIFFSGFGVQRGPAKHTHTHTHTHYCTYTLRAGPTHTHTHTQEGGNSAALFRASWESRHQDHRSSVSLDPSSLSGAKSSDSVRTACLTAHRSLWASSDGFQLGPSQFSSCIQRTVVTKLWLIEVRVQIIKTTTWQFEKEAFFGFGSSEVSSQRYLARKPRFVVNVLSVHCLDSIYSILSFHKSTHRIEMLKDTLYRKDTTKKLKTFLFFSVL